jgi:hypothetical protein
MIAEAPRLLYCDDVRDRLERTCDYIKRVYPKETDDGCMYAVSVHFPFHLSLSGLNAC